MASDNLWLTQSLVKSRAFQSLGRTAIIVYLEFKMRCKLAPLKAKTGRSKEWIIENNGHIVYTYSDALYNGITAPRFMRALDELISKGLIDVTHSGLGLQKDASTYAISNRWERWGKKDFIEADRPKDKRQGKGWALYWKKKKQKHK